MTDTILVVNALTGVETLRDLTAEEIAQRKLDAAASAAQQAEADAKAAARISALAKLSALGLTSEEIASL